jgi:serine protease
VLAVGPEALVHAVATYPQGTNPDYSSKQWDMQSGYVDYPSAWNATTPDIGFGTRVAIVDTGVEADHPDLAGQVGQGRDFVLANEAGSDFGRIDGNGHGTHVAGTAAAKDDSNGIVGGAFGATIVPARVLDCKGSGTNQQVADGIMWAADQGANGGQVKVISLSLGGPSDSGGVLGAAIQYALGQGVTVAAAAGNAGPTSCNPAANVSPLYPAAYASDQTNYPGLIAVGATDYQSAARASYSNCNLYVTVAAPGTQIWSTYAQPPNHTPTYTYLSGTSMAAPHVSAVAALVAAACPSDTPAQVRARIISGTTTVTGFGAGVGMVNAAQATAAC